MAAVGQALVDFALRGAFPEDEAVAAATLGDEATTLAAAMAALTAAQTQLEAEIHAVVEETAEDVRAWTANAKALQVDLARRKTLAREIVLASDDGEDGEDETKLTPAEADAEAHARLLTGELNYSLQVRYLLEAVRRARQQLDAAAQAAAEQRVLDALRLLEKTWTALDAMPVSRTCRALRLLDARAFEVKAEAHAALDRAWRDLVQADRAAGTLAVAAEAAEAAAAAPGGPGPLLSLADAAVAFQAYKEVDRRMADLWHDLDAAVLAARTDRAAPRGLYVDETRIGLVADRAEEAPGGVDALLDDLARVCAFLAARLPPALVPALAAAMLPDLVARITADWLAAAVPTTLAGMAAFDRALAAARRFVAQLADLGFGSPALTAGLQDWIDGAPRVWLARRREAALDAVRRSIARGLGTPQTVERIETQRVSRSEGKELAVHGAAAAAAAAVEQASDWDTAWEEEGEQEQPQDEDDGADAWAAWDEADEAGEAKPEAVPKAQPKTDPEAGTQPDPQPEPAAADTSAGADDDAETADDAVEAWGWGDEDATDDQRAEPTEPTEPAGAHDKTATRALTLKETYAISALPGAVLEGIAAVLADAAALTAAASSEDAPPADETTPVVASAAGGLFGVPALVLALFRAVSPHAYARDVAGSMYLYNDATYLAEALLKRAAADDQDRLPPAAAAALRAEATKLQAFAARAYGREMALQKTVLRDLLGGDQGVLLGGVGAAAAGGAAAADGPGSADDGPDGSDLVDAAVARVRSMAAAWQGVLAPSAWLQAVGALAEAVAQKLVADVLDMPAIGQDEAFRLAQLIAHATALDDLFGGGEEGGEGEGAGLPLTPQYAPSWLRMQYLSEVLQSNLREVRYLWMESELSLYFSADEVLDLLRLSFEDNARSREVAREIAAHPHPKEP